MIEVVIFAERAQPLGFVFAHPHNIGRECAAVAVADQRRQPRIDQHRLAGRGDDACFGVDVSLTARKSSGV